MFFRPCGSSAAACAEILSLRLSMNTPVVAVEELPVGPARAGIALHPGSDGPLCLTIAVRAVRGGEVALYGSEEPVPAADDPWLAIDAALSFAEGMGFLFDEDEVAARGEGGAEEALRLWRELADPSTEGAEPDEILLDQPATPEAPEDDESGPLPLSKFRRLAARERPGVEIPARAVAVPEATNGDPAIRLLSRF